MNSNLTPTTITDKNGKVTTVHKKPQKNTTAVPMPSPSLPQHKSKSALHRAVTKRIAELYNMNHDSAFDYRPYLTKEVRQYSEHTLHTMHRALRTDGDLAQVVAEQIVHGENALLIKETLHYYQKTESENYWRTASEIRTLANYSATNQHDDLTTVDENTQQSCIALMTFPRLIDTLPQTPSPFLDYLAGEHHDSRVINDDDLATLIAQRPDDTERIAEIVLKHGTTDAAIINGILEGALPALADGHL
jgi:hypothetical protein